MPIYAYTYLLSYLSIHYLSSYLPHTACAAKLAIFETLSIRDYWLLPYDSICNRSGKTIIPTTTSTLLFKELSMLFIRSLSFC